MFNFEKKLMCYEEKANICREEKLGKSLSTVFIDLVSNICNHDCIFCDGKYNDLQKKMFTTERLLQLVDEFVEMGVDSVLIIGDGGESTMHPGFYHFSKKLIDNNIHVGLYTNGEFLSDKVAEIASEFDFVRVSIDSSIESSHKLIHKPKNNDSYNKIIENIKSFSKIKKHNFGASFIVLKENFEEINSAVDLCENLGMDFLELKPHYLKNYKCDNAFYNSISKDLSQAISYSEKNKYNIKVVLNNQFAELIINSNSDIVKAEPRKCLCCKFRIVVSPNGYFLCTPLRNDYRYCYGDPNTDSLIDAWFGDKHKAIMDDLMCEKKCTYSLQNDVLVKKEIDFDYSGEKLYFL